MASGRSAHRLHGRAAKDDGASRVRGARSSDEVKRRNDGGSDDGQRDKIDSAAPAAGLRDDVERAYLTTEERRALLRRQISETMARVRRLTEEERMRQSPIVPKGQVDESRAAWKERRRDRLTARPTSPSNMIAPQFDPESPFEDRPSSSHESGPASRTSSYARRVEGERGSLRGERDALEGKSPSDRAPRLRSDTGVLTPSFSERKKVNVEGAISASVPSTSKDRGRLERPALPKSPNRTRRRMTVSNDVNTERKSHVVGTRRSVDLNSEQKVQKNDTNPSLNAALRSGQSRLRRTPLEPRSGSNMLESETQYQMSGLSANERQTQEDAPELSPRSLSKETSQALASLEATLSRLRAYSPASNDAKSSKEEKRTNGIGGRRSLSPSKEMRERESVRERAKQQELAQNLVCVEQTREPKMSFLARVEQTRAARQRPAMSTGESEALSKGVQVEQKVDVALPRLEASVQTRPVSRRRSLYTNSPPRRMDKEMQCAGEPDESETKINESCSSSSLVFADKSIDEAVTVSAMRIKKAFLRGTTILVDVRDQDGEDASETWIAKLREVGARVYAKPPPQTSRRRRSGPDSDREGDANQAGASVDYIIFKHGRPATTHYYRAQVDAGRTPPIIVGVNWILHSLREERKVDERDFVVEIGRQAIFAPRRQNAKTATQTADEALLRSSAAATGEGEIDHHGRDNLLARRKLMQNAPVRPSPLANRCWNLNASTSSMATTTAHNTTVTTTFSRATDDVTR